MRFEHPYTPTTHTHLATNLIQHQHIYKIIQMNITHLAEHNKHKHILLSSET